MVTDRKDPAIWAIVPAAGIGTRMRSSTPKQYLSLLGKSVLDNTLEKLLSLHELSGVVLSLNEDDQFWKHSQYVDHPKIRCVCGGAQRSDSVANALRNCVQSSEHNKTWALVHDAARPCVSVSKIRELIDRGLDYQSRGRSDGAILAVPALDTVKRACADQVVKTEDRSTLWMAQTPQFFPADTLLSALSECDQKKIAVTDESSAMESVGYKVCLVEDRRDNIKITVPEDLMRAEAILKMQTVTSTEEE